jgi:phage-related protein
MRMHAPLANHAIEKTRMNAGGRVDRVAGYPLQVKNNRLLALEKSVKVTAAERAHLWLRPSTEAKVFPVGNSPEVSTNENFLDHGLCRPTKNAHPW